jgi:hypothetical protein
MSNQGTFPDNGCSISMDRTIASPTFKKFPKMVWPWCSGPILSPCQWTGAGNFGGFFEVCFFALSLGAGLNFTFSLSRAISPLRVEN